MIWCARAMKLRAHIMYNDTSLNSLETVYLNIYQRLAVSLSTKWLSSETSTFPVSS
jgi:hypothetical protein